MLTKKQIQEATRYNAKRISDGKLKANDLSWPWNGGNSRTFPWATALFQMENKLTVDGKLGPGTEKAMDSTVVETPPKPAKPPKPPVVTVPGTYSNAIIVNGKSVMLSTEMLMAGLTASNFEQDGEHYFSERRERTAKLIHFVLHETCGNTAKGCENTLEGKGYGVQLIMAPSGHISCHGDLVLDRMVHANQLNNTSFGIEVVNPYAPMYVRDKAVYWKTIPAEWWTWCPKPKDGGPKDKRYVVPTTQQMTAIRLLSPWLCEVTGVPYRFPTKGLSKKKRQIDGLTLKPKAKPGPGIVAHRDFASHSDGRYMLEDLIGSVK